MLPESAPGVAKTECAVQSFCHPKSLSLAWLLLAAVPFGEAETCTPAKMTVVAASHSPILRERHNILAIQLIVIITVNAFGVNCIPFQLYGMSCLGPRAYGLKWRAQAILRCGHAILLWQP